MGTQEQDEKICMNAVYRCVTTVEEIRAYIGENKLVAFDFETAPDEPYRNDDKAALDPARAHIVGCSFSVSERTGIYVPIAHLSGRNIARDEFFAFLREFLMDKKITKVAHNIAFESTMAYALLGIAIQKPVYDTICAAQLSKKNAYEFRKLGDSGLKTLVCELLNQKLPTFAETTGGRHFDELPANAFETVRYGAADSDFALRLYNLFTENAGALIPKHRFLVEEVESPTAVYIGIMKANGLPVDSNSMDQCSKKAKAERLRLQAEIQSIIDNVNIGQNCSTNAFKNYLFDTLQLPVLKRTDSGSPSVDDEAMQLLEEWCEENKPSLMPLFSQVPDYRKWSKIALTYIDGYKKQINSVTGRIHPDMFSLSTDTGRLCCRNPNAQNMPRKGNDPVGVRDFIQAPEGHVILSLDFSQIELRVGAFYCRDEKMMDVYRNNGDIHAATTSVIFSVSPEEASDKHHPKYKERRTIAKNVNFGTFYGLFPRGLQKTLKLKAGINKSEEECRDIIDNLKQGYRRLSVWQEVTKADAAFRGYTETWLGRRRYLPDILSDDWCKKSFAERCALNTPIQGTAADIIKLAMGRILARLPERMWLKPILQIHDELVFEIPKDKLEESVAFVRKCMEERPFPEFDIPLVAEAAAGKSFGSMKELED